MRCSDQIHRLAGLVILTALVAVQPVLAGPGIHTSLVLLEGDGTTQEQQYRERQVLEPESDDWVTKAADPTATPSGTLDEARSLLARGKPGKARKLLRGWIEDNPDHERYYEGQFLLGEAEFERADYYRAYEHYEVVVENTAGELFRAALRREKDVALAFLSGEKRIVWKFMRLPARDEAIDILDRIWERVPGTRLGEEALRIKADYFFGRGDMDLAQDEYANLAREYPGGRYVQLAMLRSAEAAEAAFPGIRFDDRPLLEAEDRYRQVNRAYPAYARRENVEQRLVGIQQLRAEKDLDIARWYERTRQPTAAEFYYRLVIQDWADTLAAAEARQRLRAMGVDLETEESVP
ncbi:MAG: outer membrane protein assembly factor BamD [Planctomycetota bacterium]